MNTNGPGLETEVNSLLIVFLFKDAITIKVDQVTIVFREYEQYGMWFQPEHGHGVSEL